MSDRFQRPENTSGNEEFKVFRIGKPSVNSKSDKAILSGIVINPVTGNLSPAQ